jgi:hypothetical protein
MIAHNCNAVTTKAVWQIKQVCQNFPLRPLILLDCGRTRFLLSKVQSHNSPGRLKLVGNNLFSHSNQMISTFVINDGIFTRF